MSSGRILMASAGPLTVLAAGVLGLGLAHEPQTDLEDLGHEGLSRALEPCRAMDEPMRASCAFTQMNSVAFDLGLLGKQVMVLCERLEGRDPYGWCVDFSMGLHEPPDPSICSTIPEELPRNSCRLRRADRLVKALDLQGAVAACKDVGDLAEHCYVHIVAERGEFWPRRGSLVLAEEVGMLVELAPEVHEYVRVGSGVAEVASRMVGLNEVATICQLFAPDGRAHEGCMAHTEVRQRPDPKVRQR